MENLGQFESVRTRTVDFRKIGSLLPALIISAGLETEQNPNGRLYLGYMNQRTLETTLETGKVTMWSMRSGRPYQVGDGGEGGFITEDVMTDFERTLLLIEATSDKRTGN
ncbi:MAG: hypothetical protein JWM52_69 [Candidatus Saccharibacteria bacterium]|nr:hypothetical protein [Candidatus Saccharibacteria bacterium]